MAKIIEFKRRPKKPEESKAAPKPQVQGLQELVRELLKLSIDLDKFSENSSVAEIYEFGDQIQLRLSLPSKNPENLRVGLISNLIRIREKTSTGESLIQSIPLPYSVNLNKVSAVYRDGFLEVTLEKKASLPEEELVFPVD